MSDTTPRLCLWLKTDGDTEEIYPDGEDGKFSLEALQDRVGGYIECIPGVLLRPEDRLIINEEGQIQKLSLNRRASMLAGQPIVGNAVLLSLDQLE